MKLSKRMIDREYNKGNPVDGGIREDTRAQARRAPVVKCECADCKIPEPKSSLIRAIEA